MPSTIRPRHFMHSPFAALDEFMNLATREGSNGNCCGATAPVALPIDIRERQHDFIVEASLPGFKRNEIEVQMHEGRLTISANREASSTSGDETWILRERAAARLARHVRLPEGVSGEGIKAELVDGVLTVLIPKPAQLQPQKISIA